MRLSHYRGRNMMHRHVHCHRHVRERAGDQGYQSAQGGSWSILHASTLYETLRDIEGCLC